MPMLKSCSQFLRRVSLMLATAALLLGIPTSASADKPRGKRPAASASRSRAQAKPIRRASVARPAARRAATARKAKASRASSRASSRRRAVSAAGRRRAGSRRRSVPTSPLVPVVAQASFVSDSADRLRDSIVSLARQQIGTPYIWGAETPGSAFDCSGLVKYVMSWLNVKLPRTANEQSYAGIRIGRSLDRMKPGDLLTFGTGRRITHIAIYSGNGRYVHASRPGVGVVESLLDPSARRFRGAIRLVADADTGLTRNQILR